MNDRTNNPPGAEDSRVTLARQTLAESQATTPSESDMAPAHWWGRLEETVKQLLAVIDGTES